jgi:hypothetical protein
MRGFLFFNPGGLMEAHVRKRTIWIWVIFVFLGLYTGISLLGMIQVHSGKLPLTPAQKEYFESASFLDIALTLACSLFILCGAFALLLFQRLSFHLFVIGLVLSAVDHVWDLVQRLQLSGPPGGGGDTLHAVVYYGFVLAACFYSRTLIKKGVLT